VGRFLGHGVEVAEMVTKPLLALHITVFTIVFTIAAFAGWLHHQQGHHERGISFSRQLGNADLLLLM